MRLHVPTVSEGQPILRIGNGRVAILFVATAQRPELSGWVARMTDWDDDGYPTGEAFESLRRFKGTPEAYVERVRELSRNGFVRVEDSVDQWGQAHKKLEVVTGGWSGVEQLVSVMEETMFWFAFWESSHRGGLFTFDVPADTWTAEANWGKPGNRG